MKRSVEYAPWAEKFRTKGRTIRKVRNGYGLYSCTSVHIPGLAYPKSVQTYLGMITEKDGFIPKKPVSGYPLYLEYGLSHVILINFSRSILRSVYNSRQDELIDLGIIQFVFQGTDESLIRATYLSYGKEDAICSYKKTASASRISAVSNKIAALFKEKIPDDDQRNILLQLLRNTVVDAAHPIPESCRYAQDAAAIMERNGLRYE